MGRPLRAGKICSGPMATLAADLRYKLTTELAKFAGVATTNDHYLALAYAVRDRLLRRWVESARMILASHRRTVIYLSAEYLIGPQLGDESADPRASSDEAREAASQRSALTLDDADRARGGAGPRQRRPGPARRLLHGLARDAATSPPSATACATSSGSSTRTIRDGWQVERTDRWLHAGNPWEVRRYEIRHTVGFGGHTEHDSTRGRCRVRWPGTRRQGRALRHAGRGVRHARPRTSSGCGARSPSEEFDLDAFQVGDYWRAVDAKIRSENLTKVLYPNDVARPANSCASSSSTSSCRARCRTASGCCLAAARRSTSSPRSSRSSSTIPTRPSRSRS